MGASAFTLHSTVEWIWRHQRRPLVTPPWPASVQDFRRRLFVAEPSLLRVAVLPVLVLRSVRARVADFHGCESAALTRLCGRAALGVLGENLTPP